MTKAVAVEVESIVNGCVNGKYRVVASDERMVADEVRVGGVRMVLPDGGSTVLTPEERTRNPPLDVARRTETDEMGTETVVVDVRRGGGDEVTA